MPQLMMGYPLLHDSILIILLITLRQIQAHVIDTSFNMVEQGQKLTGKIGADMVVGSPQECSLRCLVDSGCQGYQYHQMTTGKMECTLIHKGCGRNFQSNDENTTDGKVVLMTNEREKVNKMWIAPCGWSGPEAAFYQSFDSSDGFILYEELNKTNSVKLVLGQVNSALSLDGTKLQWIDLGIHTEACMTRPETCGAAGGAISLWVKFMSVSTSGIISSMADGSSGFYLLYSSIYITFRIKTQDEEFRTKVPRPEPHIWTHIVMNYLGPNGDDSILVYFNGTEVVPIYTSTFENNNTLGDGRVVMGRKFPDGKIYSMTIMVDEFIFFNQALNNTEIQLIYNSTKF